MIFLRNKWTLFIFFCASLMSGCSHLPAVRFDWPEGKLVQQIEELKAEKQNILDTFEVDREKVKREILENERARYSKGTAQVYAAEGTLQASEAKDKYTQAALGALRVAKEALPTPTFEDLLLANETQKKLISEQAQLIKEGKLELEKAKGNIIQLKNNEEELRLKKEKLQAEYDKKVKELNGSLEKAVVEWEAEKQKLVDQLNAKAIEYDKQNSFWARINPFDDLAKFATSIFWWVIIIATLGFILKICSVIFPGTNIFGIIIEAIGKMIGGFFGLFTKWIPGALDGMGAVDYKKHSVERDIANNTVGAIQEIKNENPNLYKRIKPYLEDWFKDTPPDRVEVVDKKIKELNLK